MIEEQTPPNQMRWVRVNEAEVLPTGPPPETPSGPGA